MGKSESWLDIGLRLATIMVGLFVMLIAILSVIQIDRIFDDDLFGGTSGTDQFVWITIVSAFAVPMFLAGIWWEESGQRACLSIGVFLLLMFPLIGVSQVLVRVSFLIDSNYPSWIIAVSLFLLLPGIALVHLLLRERSEREWIAD